MNIILLLCTPDYWTGYIEHYCVRQAIGLDTLSTAVYARLLDWIHWALLCTPGYWTGYIEHRCVRQAIGLDTLYTIHGLDYWTRLWNRAWWIMNGELWIVILLDNKRWKNTTTVYSRPLNWVYWALLCTFRPLNWVHWAPLYIPDHWTGYTEHYCVLSDHWTGYIEHRCIFQTIELGILYTIHGLDYWTRLWNRAWWIMNGELWIVVLSDKMWIW